MSELEDRINSVLGDPEQMEKITRLAQSLMAGGGEEKNEGRGQPDALSSLFSSFGGGDAGDIDPAMIGRISRIISGANGDKKQERALLEAMRPYLSEKRRGKMDKALKIARLAGIAKLAMGEMGVSGDDKPVSG